MNKITRLLVLLLPIAGFSQSGNEKIQAYLNANHTKLGLTAQDVTGWIVESEATSESTKIHNYYIKQRHNGIEVFGAVTNVWVKNEQVINIGDRFVSNAAQKANALTPSISVTEGLSAAFNLVGAQNPGGFQIIESTGTKNFKITNGALTEDPVVAELVYQPTDNALRLAWDYTFYTQDHSHLWSVRIDALDGKLLDKHDMVISCNFDSPHKHSAAVHVNTEFTKNFFRNSNSIVDIQSGSYRVIPFNIESPNHGPRQLLVSPHDPVASPFGWHDTNGIAGNEYTFTRGNNAWAMEDANGNDGTGASPDAGASMVFDYPYGGTSVQASTYQNAAITNLFYMTNMMHDVWFHYGFNEQNGNFQQKNYSGFVQPGFGGDTVVADAQDGSALEPQNINNANFSTPVDGTRPRMQMFLWNVIPSIQPLHILAPSDFAGPRDARDNSFEPGHIAIPIAPAVIQSDLVLFNDGTPDIGQTDNADACSAAVNAAALNGHIAVIRRSLAEEAGGTPCTFIEKVKNAQNAGATAAIIVNNVDGIIGMSGADETITIPAISVTKEVGDAIMARMQTQTVTAKIQLESPPFINADGDFDNGIIAHEFGHGISTRLTGGANNSNCLFNEEQAGEGWSDWFSLIMMLKAGDVGSTPREVATFAISQPVDGFGIRNFPYSTDMSVNPLTFADSNDAESHNRGEFMATVLWDLTWAYINKYGFDPNVYSGTGGNNKAMRLVLDALKLQPCSPTFVEYRNALIAADQATTGGDDYCMIWSVFARRGMGVNASSGLRTNALDQVEDFTTPAPGPNCTLAVNHIDNEELIRVYPNPSNGMITIRINQFSGKVNMNIVDINGRKVYSTVNEDFNTEKNIDLGHLQSGMYILNISGDALNYTQKIILR
ncbi:MAG TPA: T9SS-dependent M36 family metallopeptidase [Flavobacterium sp.]|jgi:hypothetical protein